MTLQLHRITPQIAGAVAVAALAAPTALGAGDLRSPDTRDAALAAREAAAAGLDLRSPDTKDVAAAIQARSSSPRSGDLRSPDTRDWAAGRLGPAGTGGVEITVHRPGGFDWSDAAIGAAFGAGLILLLSGTWLLVRHAHAEPRPA